MSKLEIKDFDDIEGVYYRDGVRYVVSVNLTTCVGKIKEVLGYALNGKAVVEIEPVHPQEVLVIELLEREQGVDERNLRLFARFALNLTNGLCVLVEEGVRDDRSGQ